MRLAAVLKILAIFAFFAAVGVAGMGPTPQAAAHLRAPSGPLWFAWMLFALGCAATLKLTLALFGLRAKLSAPLFIALGAPIVLRLAFGGLISRIFRRAPTTPPAPPRPAGPYAFPPRIATALIAAARARK